MKKKLLFAALICACTSSVFAQNNVGINNPSPAATAALDVTSTTQGMLVPRMLASQRLLIGTPGTPATGLLVYQTDAPAGFYFYNGSAWISLNAATPIGAAGGDLSGTYPNPSLSTSAATGANVVTAINASSSAINAARLQNTVTTQGNSFNGASQLVQMNASAQLPAASGINLTSLSASNIALGNLAVTRLDGGLNAGSGTFWRGDGSWSAPGAPAVPFVKVPVTGSASYTVAAGSPNYLFDFQGNSGSGQVLTITLPAASAFPSGSVIYLNSTGYITGAPTMTFTSSGAGQTFSAFANNNTSISGASVTGQPGGGARLLSDGVSHYYRLN